MSRGGRGSELVGWEPRASTKFCLRGGCRVVAFSRMRKQKGKANHSSLRVAAMEEFLGHLRPLP